MNSSLVNIPTGYHRQVPDDWFPATLASPFIFDDPGLVWLEYHGEKHGFQPDESPYEFLDFISEKGRQFERKWLGEMAADAEVVCQTPSDVLESDKVKQTFEFMQAGVPVIYQPALWWAPERIYGVPDLIVHSSWLRSRYPSLITDEDAGAQAVMLGKGGEDGHYLVMDLKFTTRLDSRSKSKDIENFAAQVRIYSYMLGQLQGYMPKNAFLIARDRIVDPIPIVITSQLDHSLDADLAAFRELFVEIKLNGDQYRPWLDNIVAINLDHSDDRWRTAKCTIAREFTPGGDTSLMYFVGQKSKRHLADLGYPSLESLLMEDPETIPFEDLKGIGSKTAGRMRAIITANKNRSPILPPAKLIPENKPHEFFVDYEYFTNVNVDFDEQWPALEGKEMIFMVGLGWLADGEWQFETITAEAEGIEYERVTLERFIQRLEELAGRKITGGSHAALYHWTGAEVWQSTRAADRHQLPEDHLLRNLPWIDLSKAFTDGPGAVPGSWGFGLKEMARSLGEHNPEYAVEWPGELDEGLSVMVMGWEAYRKPNPLEAKEMDTIRQYLETDCKALYEILLWLRDQWR